ncbi:putative RNA-directed DNA polymerase [Helianthus debilis subsp. tardiflorus]
MLTLGLLDFDYALRENKPADLTATSTAAEQIVHDKWTRCNHMSLMFMKQSIHNSIRGAIPDSENAKTYLASVEDQFKGTSKAHASTLILKLVTTKYDGRSGIREHIMMMHDMANKLKGLEMAISDGFLVHFIITSLPSSYEAFKINYNTQKDKWTMSELIAMCVQEEERMKMDRTTEKEQMSQIPYASVVGSLMYAQVCTRPDIAYIAGMLGRYQTNPGLDHWKAAKKVLRYLQGTKDYKLTYRRSDRLEVVGYSDSDFAKCKDDKKSTSGYIFMLAGGPISWKSHKQQLTTTSTMMAEYIAVYNATCHGMLLRNLITGLKIVNSISRPLKLYCDNSAAVSFSNSNSSTGAGLYLDTKYLFVRERVEENNLCIEYISTKDMLADPMTKGLPPKVFEEHVSNMGLTKDLV